MSTARNGEVRRRQNRTLAVLAAVAWLHFGSAAHADCAGGDLFAIMRKDFPDDFARLIKDARSMPFGSGVLFKVERDGLKPSYLFGTLHLPDARIARLPPSVEAALDDVSVLMLETVDPSTFSAGRTSDESRGTLRASLVAEAGHRPDQLLTKDEFARLAKEAKSAALPDATLAALKPTVVALLLGTSHCAQAPGTGQPFLDSLLAAAAERKGLKTVGLETLPQQIQALDGLSPEAERSLLLSTTIQSEHEGDLVETTIRRYLDGDTGAIVAWMRSPSVIPGLLASQTPPAFLTRLLDLRNKSMLVTALPLLERGGVFIAVGVAHLPGDDGLAEAIKRQGFRMSVVDPR